MTVIDDQDEVMVYASGLCCCSVCAPQDMPLAEVEKRVNAIHPTGFDSGWLKADDEFFKDGKTPNGGVVNCHRGTTRHWLLIC